MVIKTVACDTHAVAGESYLREDYGISCNTDKHKYFRIYAGIMMVVSRDQPIQQQLCRWYPA